MAALPSSSPLARPCTSAWAEAVKVGSSKSLSCHSAASCHASASTTRMSPLRTQPCDQIRAPAVRRRSCAAAATGSSGRSRSGRTAGEGAVLAVARDSGAALPSLRLGRAPRWIRVPLMLRPPARWCGRCSAAAHRDQGQGFPLDRVRVRTAGGGCAAPWPGKRGWAFAWRTLIAAELVFGASSGQGGLGWYIFQNRNELHTDNVFAGLALVVLIGLAVETLVFATLERVTVRRWGQQR